MAGELRTFIDRINAKTQIILERYHTVVAERDEALATVKALKDDVYRLQAENERLRTEADFLKVATTIAPERSDVERTRNILSELVREIDKCITELTE